MEELGIERNDYIGLLSEDFRQMKHPNTGKVITLYRIIALKTFSIKTYNRLEKEWETLEIPINTIGGYVEKIENLDPDSENWVGITSRVFDNAVIKNNTFLNDNSIVCENAIIDNSRIFDNARVYGNARVINSDIRNITEIRDNAVVIDTLMRNSTLAFENVKLKGCKVSGGSVARGEAVAENTEINDTSQIHGDAILIKCQLNNRAVVKEGEHEGETFSISSNLKQKRLKGDLFPH